MSSSKGVTKCSLFALTEQHEIVSKSFHVRLPHVKHIDLHSSDTQSDMILILQSTRFSLYWADHSTGVMLVLVCSSMVALSYNVIHSLMIQKTSAVTTTVLGEVKIIGLLLLSALLLGTAFCYNNGCICSSLLHAVDWLCPVQLLFAAEQVTYIVLTAKHACQWHL